MARRSRVAWAPAPAPEPTDPGPGAADGAELAPETAADRLATIIERGKQYERGKVRVQRVKENGQLSLCNEWRPEDFEQGGGALLIRKKYGPGRYLVEVFGTNAATGRFTGYARDQIEIEPTLEPDPADGINATLERIEKLFTAKPAGEAAAAPAKSSMEQLREMLGMLVLFKEALGVGGPPPPPVSMVEQLGQLVQVMRGTRELASTIDPSPEPADPLLALAEKALPIIGEAIKQGQGQPAGLSHVTLPPTLAGPVASPSAVPGAASVAPPAESGGVVTEDEFTAVRQGVRGVNTLAALKVNPEGAAQLIYDSDEFPDEAIELLKLPDWFDKLAQIEPSCAHYRAWYQQVRDHLVAYAAEDNAPDTAPPAAANGNQAAA